MIPQLQIFPGIVEPPHKRPEGPRDARLSFEGRRVERDDKISSTRDDCLPGKLEEHRIGEVPAGDVDIDGHLVVKLHPLELGFARERVVVDLIENDNAVAATGCRGQEEAQGQRQAEYDADLFVP